MTIQRFGSLPTETILPTADGIAWQAFIPVFTGFSVDPGGEFRFCAFGDTVVVIVTMSTVGTSNAADFTMTLPFDSNRVENTFGLSMSFVDAGDAAGPGMLRLSPGSNILELYNDASTTNDWTTSGAKAAQFTFIYERDFTEPTY